MHYLKKIKTKTNKKTMTGVAGPGRLGLVSGPIKQRLARRPIFI